MTQSGYGQLLPPWPTWLGLLAGLAAKQALILSTTTQILSFCSNGKLSVNLYLYFHEERNLFLAVWPNLNIFNGRKTLDGCVGGRVRGSHVPPPIRVSSRPPRPRKLWRIRRQHPSLHHLCRTLSIVLHPSTMVDLGVSQNSGEWGVKILDTYSVVGHRSPQQGDTWYSE